MGTALSKAANGVGSALGNAFTAPIKTIFGRSCEGICVGTWDLICFIEHLCISSLLRLFMVSVLGYTILLFFYLLFKVGIIQCLGRGFCKMACAACEAYWTAMEEIVCFLWHKLKNTKRVYRHRFENMEEELGSSDDDYSSSDSYESIRFAKRRRSVREKRRDHLRQSLYPRRHGSERRRHGCRSHGHVRFKSREVSVHMKGSGRRRSSGQIQLRSRERYIGPNLLFKRRGRF